MNSFLTFLSRQDPFVVMTLAALLNAAICICSTVFMTTVWRPRKWLLAALVLVGIAVPLAGLGLSAYYRVQLFREDYPGTLPYFLLMAMFAGYSALALIGAGRGVFDLLIKRDPRGAMLLAASCIIAGSMGSALYVGMSYL